MPGLEGTVVKQYHIQRLLGSGGMSEVYLAYDEVAEQYVAIKVMTGYAADYLERFRREAEAIDKLHHPHILPALDYEECVPWHMLVMVYAPGGTLRDVLAQGPLDPDEADVLLEQIASAIQFAHDNGVLHRDIKPSNILLRDRSYVYLADFGLAKLVDATGELTRTGVLMGTPEYMAPDLASIPASISTDVYSLGVLLYQMLTARLPFEAETPVAVFWKHLREEPLPPSLHNPALTRAIDRVVLRALAKDPTHRYSSAMELADAYQQALLAPAEEENNSTSLDIEIEQEEYEQVVLADSASLPASALVSEAASADAAPLQSRRRALFSPARRLMSSRPVLPLVARRRASRRARRLDYATPAGVDPESSVHLSSVSPARTDAPPLRRRRRMRGRSTAPITERTRNHPRAKRRNHLVWGIIGAGILLFIILPASTIYYLYATRPVNTAMGDAHSAPITSTSQSADKVNLKTPPTSKGSTTPGQLLLQDELTSNTNGRWSEAADSCVFAYGSYRVMHSQGAAELPCALISPLIGDASIQVNVSLLSGNTVDMLLRLRGEQYYVLRMNSAGQFSFLRHDAGAALKQYVTLLKPTASSAIVPGSGVNTLLVLAQGSDFKLYVNGIFLGEVHDSNYKSGQLAFQVDTTSSTEQAIASLTHFKLSSVTP